jgi:hypothetical protein
VAQATSSYPREIDPYSVASLTIGAADFVGAALVVVAEAVAAVAPDVAVKLAKDFVLAFALDEQLRTEPKVYSSLASQSEINRKRDTNLKHLHMLQLNVSRQTHKIRYTLDEMLNGSRVWILQRL